MANGNAWYSNPDLWASLASAYAGYQGARDQNEYVAAASGPQPFNRTDITEAHPAAFPYLEGLFPQAQQNYQAQLGRIENNPMPTYQANVGGGGGGGGGGRPGLDFGGSSQPTQDVRGALVNQAMNGNGYIQQAQQQALALGQGGAAVDPYFASAFGAAQGATQGTPTDPNLQRFINQGFRGGYDGSEGYMQQFLQGLMVGQQAPPQASTADANVNSWVSQVPGAAPTTAATPPGPAYSPAPLQKPTPQAQATPQQQTFGGPSVAERRQSTAGNAASSLAAMRGRFAEGSPQRAQLEAKIAEAQAGTQPAIRSGASYAIDQGVGSGAGGGSQEGIAAYQADQQAQAQQQAAPPPGAGQGGAPPPAAPPPPQDVANKSYGGQYDNPLFNKYIENLLNGGELGQGNPHTQALLDRMTRESDKATNLQTAQLDAQSEGAGRYGSGLYQNMRGNIAASGQQALADAQSGMLFNLYNTGLDRQLSGAGMLSGRDQAVWGDKTAREGIDASRDAAMASAGAAGQASANANATQLELQQNQLAYDRWAAEQGFGLQRQGLTLDAINSYSGNELGAAGLLGGAVGQGAAMGNSNYQAGLGLMGQLGDASATRGLQGQLGALGLAGGLNEAGYYGLNSALGGSLAVDQLDTQAAQMGSQAQMQQQQAGLANRQANAQRQYQSDLQRWQYEQQAHASAFEDYMRQVLAASGGIGSVAQSSGQSAGTPPGPTVNPLVAAGQLGFGTWLSSRNNQGGG